jgi:hypothetical protein
MTNNRNAVRRNRAQAVVHEHVNKRRGEGSKHDWNFIHVIHMQSLENGAWQAVVLVQGLNQQMFQVIQEPDTVQLKVDTFTRQHVSRFY